METSATALTELAKGAKARPIVNDECDIFGKDVANSVQAINNVQLQRHVKFYFILRNVIYQAAQTSDPFICFNTFQDNGVSYHKL